MRVDGLEITLHLSGSLDHSGASEPTTSENDMSGLTPDMEKHVRAIVAEMIGAALQGADQRLQEVVLSYRQEVEAVRADAERLR